jgi:Transcription factor WhiB
VPDQLGRGRSYGDEQTDLGALLEMIYLGRPQWQKDALCREAPATVSWFPERGQPVLAAKRICARSLVSQECGEWALAQGPDLQGIWAGSSPAERARLRSPSRTVRATDWGDVPAGVLDRCGPVDPDAA